MATARQVSEWAIGNALRTHDLHKAFQGGMDDLYGLCLRVGGLTMEKIRHLHLARFSTVNPLSNKIDQMAADQWYAIDGFWNGDVSEPGTVHCDPERSAFQIMIYWELFGSTLRAYLEPDMALPKFDLQTRLEFIKYCIPDWICDGGYPGFEVLAIGPYLPKTKKQKPLQADQIALHHILHCGRWERLWQKRMLDAGPEFEDEWRQVLWKNACMSFGLESMEVIQDLKVTSEVDPRYLTSDTVEPDPALTAAWQQRLSNIREQIEMLDSVRHRPKTTLIGSFHQYPLSEAPNIADEIYICMAAYWHGARP